MNRGLAAWIFAWVGLALGAQNLEKLPDWARAAAQEGLQATPPEGADAWVLLDRTEFAYSGSGEIRLHRYRLVRVLGERGLSQATYLVWGMSGKGNRITSIKGWNSRPDGEVTKLDSNQVVTRDSDDADELTTGMSTDARLNRVVIGSLVAFESDQVMTLPGGVGAIASVLQDHPVRRFELALAKREGWFTNLKDVQMRLESRGFKSWLGLPEVTGGTQVVLRDLPTVPKAEPLTPALRDVLPRIFVRFLDPSNGKEPLLESWDSIARWYAQEVAKKGQSLALDGVSPNGGRSTLEGILGWIHHQISYRMVYLSPERGLIPEEAAEVKRKRYGDCKDMATLGVAACKGGGFEAYPVLAQIGPGRIPEDMPVLTAAFNHVILAVRLTQPLGCASEVETPRGRFLLIDPTDTLTPFGWLGVAHLSRRVMVCLPEGAQWVEVPRGAILNPAIEARLEGALDVSGRFRGRVVLVESGNGLNLRGVYSEQSAEVQKQALASLLSLPLDASWKVEEASDPKALDQPFKLTLTVDYPKAFRHEGNDWVFSDFLFPGPSPAILRPGQTRHYPVAYSGHLHWSIQGRIELADLGFRPLLEAANGSTAFRSWDWKGEVKGILWQFQFTHDRKEASFDLEHKDEGVKAAKGDRARYRSFLGDALALRRTP